MILIKTEKIFFETNFNDWVKIFLNDQESCVMNGGVTTQYFKLKKGAWQGDPISACLYYAEKYFLQLLRTTYIKGLTIRITDIKGLNIFGNMFLYTT